MPRPPGARRIGGQEPIYGVRACGAPETGSAIGRTLGPGCATRRAGRPPDARVRNMELETRAAPPLADAVEREIET